MREWHSGPQHKMWITGQLHDAERAPEAVWMLWNRENSLAPAGSPTPAVHSEA
jgi:hypothetical protein